MVIISFYISAKKCCLNRVLLKFKILILILKIQRYTTYANCLEEKISSERANNSNNMMPQINIINSISPNIENLNFQHNNHHFMPNATFIPNEVFFTSANGSKNGHHHHNNHLTNNHSLLNGNVMNNSHIINTNVSHLNSKIYNFNDPTSKSMPTTPTHLTSSSIKNVNFNISPSTANNKGSFMLSESNGESLSPTNTITTTVTANTTTTTPTLNSKKFSYLD